MWKKSNNLYLVVKKSKKRITKDLLKIDERFLSEDRCNVTEFHYKIQNNLKKTLDSKSKDRIGLHPTTDGERLNILKVHKIIIKYRIKIIQDSTRIAKHLTQQQMIKD